MVAGVEGVAVGSDGGVEEGVRGRRIGRGALGQAALVELFLAEFAVLALRIRIAGDREMGRSLSAVV